jgi:hypothetical protein
MKLTELSDENLVQFHILASSFYKVKKFIVENKTFEINDIEEIEVEMAYRSAYRSTKYWQEKMLEVKKRLTS